MFKSLFIKVHYCIYQINFAHLLDNCIHVGEFKWKLFLKNIIQHFFMFLANTVNRWATWFLSMFTVDWQIIRWTLGLLFNRQKRWMRSPEFLRRDRTMPGRKKKRFARRKLQVIVKGTKKKISTPKGTIFQII